MVSNGKGIMSLANPYGTNPYKKEEEAVYQWGQINGKIHAQYIGSLFSGTLQVLDIPDAKQMGVYSKTVYQDTPYYPDSINGSAIPQDNPVPGKLGDISPIKYVFYIIKVLTTQT